MSDRRQQWSGVPAILILVSLILLGLPGCTGGSASGDQKLVAVNTPGVMPRPDPLTCPTLPADPTQADQGAVVYCLVCMQCHGDKGQGLDAWRQELAPPDNNCFQAKCHGPAHPFDGFEIPKYAPPLIGTGLLDHFQNALTLHNYIQSAMPWQKPGYLKPEEYWQLTAFLIQVNGFDLGSLILDEQNASQVLINSTQTSGVYTGPITWPYIAFGLVILLAALVWVIFYVRKPRQR